MTRAGLSGATLVLLVVSVVGSAVASRAPNRSEKSAMVAALRSQQGKVPVQSIAVSTREPGYASLVWGFANNGHSAKNVSLLRRSGGAWKVVWTREVEQSAVSACIHAPAAAVKDLFGLVCPSAASLRGRAASASELAAMLRGFHHSSMTPYAMTSVGLKPACISRLAPTWAAASANFSSGGSVIVWFRHTIGWAPVFESLIQHGAPPPPPVVLSLASCVGYDPGIYGA